MGLILAFDYGSKRVGVAVSDSEGISIRPLVTLAAHKGLPNKNEVAHYIDEFCPTQLIVGLPVAGGTVVDKSRAGAHALAMWLRKHFGLPVAMCDESYSSVVNPKENRDAYAASTILQDWLNQQKNSRNQQ